MVKSRRLIANLTPIEKPRMSEAVDNSITMRDDTSHSPVLCEMANENKSINGAEKNLTPASIRGVFFKEHISTKERQKEQDQKKSFKEQLE